MSEELYFWVLRIWILVALALFPLLLRITAPYGRHSRRDWGPMIPNRLAWVIMELPSLIMFLLFFLGGTNSMSLPLLIFFLLYSMHYIHRAIIFPLRTHTARKLMPLIIAVFAIFFNLINGSLNGHFFGTISDGYEISWLYGWRFILGSLLFVVGALINLRADSMLLSLRRKNKNGYAVPEGGLFNLISCPNFFGEILEWAGFAIMTWSPAALAFAIWTLVNLVPRAIDHHKWYRQKFENYPPDRKAVIPFIL